jgi:FtsZ-binding cell division protein ZapB
LLQQTTNEYQQKNDSLFQEVQTLRGQLENASQSIHQLHATKERVSVMSEEIEQLYKEKQVLI